MLLLTTLYSAKPHVQTLTCWGTLSCCALGCHAFDGVCPNCYAPSYIGVLDYAGVPD